MNKLHIRLLMIIFLAFSSTAFAQDTVRVGGYIFPPFVERGEDGSLKGMTLDLIDLLNAYQDNYHFEFYLTTPSRRHKDFSDGKYNTLFFEDKRWGWQEYNVEETKSLIGNNQVYIANKINAKTQEYFDSLKNKTILAVRGYSYGFADYISDPIVLSRLFRIRLVTEPDTILPLIIKNRADVSILSESYLLRKFKEHPDILNNLIISKKNDSNEKLGLLNGGNSSISTSELNNLLDKCIEEKALELFWLQQYLDMAT